MDELGKVKRVIEKAGAQVDETLLVLDAQTGQNGIAQARAFTEAVEVTGVVLTKTGRFRQGRHRPGGPRGARASRSVSSAWARVPTTCGPSRPGCSPNDCSRARSLRRWPERCAKILIVEDHPTMREAMRLVLEGEGFEIDEAADGSGGARARCGPTRPISCSWT